MKISREEEIQLGIDKICEEFRASRDVAMVVMSRAEYQQLIRTVVSRSVQAGWEEGMADSKYVKSSSVN
tara:strand:+ start:1227 stop:1433 length:207 start_codon:yes stop_codon:yes gene_type:complete